MITGYPRTLTVAAAVAAALVAGVFFAFSTFVMPALRRLPAAQGIAAMQSINKQAPASPLFMAALFGTGALCIGLAITAAVSRFDERSGKLQILGAALYLVCIVLTAAYHVPRNDALNLLDPSAAGSAEAWRHYLTGWIAWNHVRAVASLAGSVAFVLALRAG
jgi:uncharacterized membrane protein